MTLRLVQSADESETAAAAKDLPVGDDDIEVGFWQWTGMLAALVALAVAVAYLFVPGPRAGRPRVDLSQQDLTPSLRAMVRAKLPPEAKGTRRGPAEQTPVVAE